jgi:hypothetical protein
MDLAECLERSGLKEITYVYGDVLTREEALQILLQSLLRNSISFDKGLHHLDGVLHEVLRCWSLDAKR